MKQVMAVVLLYAFVFGKSHSQIPDNHTKSNKDSVPNFMIGNFMDDYGIKYAVSDSIWIQLPKTKYHILKWNTTKQYIIAKNDTANKADKGLYTRIDYMQFQNMEPFKWGFCLTAYDAATDAAAEATAAADRNNPRKGCNGYPFSRMKKTE